MHDLARKNRSVTQLYRRPTDAVKLNVEPRLASWEATGRLSQVRLAGFLDHLDSIVTPKMASFQGRLAVELIVGLPSTVPLTTGGRDLDNYLYPVAHRLGATRIAAMFGRKIYGPSRLAVGLARPETDTVAPMFIARITGSYTQKEWKHTLRDQLLRAKVSPAEPGPVAINIAMTTGTGRNWANLWKPLLDSFGPVLGEHVGHPFHPYDDRIVNLGLHHSVDTGIGHDVIIAAWWNNAKATY